MQSPIDNPPIPNHQSYTIRHNPTKSNRNSCVRAFPLFTPARAHTRNSPKNATTVRRVHPCGTHPTPIIPHSQTTPFPPSFRHSHSLPRHSHSLPRHSHSLPRHSREGGNLPACGRCVFIGDPREWIGRNARRWELGWIPAFAGMT